MSASKANNETCNRPLLSFNKTVTPGHIEVDKADAMLDLATFYSEVLDMKAV